MLKPTTIFVALLSFALCCSTAMASPSEKAKSVADTAIHGLEKADDAVVHVAKTGVEGATRGVNKAGAAVTRVIKKAGLPADPPPAPRKDETPQ